MFYYLLIYCLSIDRPDHHNKRQRHQKRKQTSNAPVTTAATKVESSPQEWKLPIRTLSLLENLCMGPRREVQLVRVLQHTTTLVISNLWVARVTLPPTTSTHPAIILALC